MRLAQASGDKDALSGALTLLTEVHTKRGDLAAANETSIREFNAAAGASDRLAGYFAYINRVSIYHAEAEKCQFQRDFEPCFKAVESARADEEAALAIVRQLNYPGAQRIVLGMISSTELLRLLVEARRQSHQRLSQDQDYFQPKEAKHVLVTEDFVDQGSNPLLSDRSDPANNRMIAAWEPLRRDMQNFGRFANTSSPGYLFELGLNHASQGRHDAALEWYLKAVDALERDRRSLHDERGRSSFSEAGVDIYYYAILELLQRRSHAEAFELLERSRSRALADLLQSRPLDFNAGEAQALYAEASTLRARIADAQSRLFQGGDRADAAESAEMTRMLTARINADEASYQATLARMATQAPRLHELVNSSPASLQSLQASMRAEGYEVLQYLVTETALIVWHITPIDLSILHDITTA